MLKAAGTTLNRWRADTSGTVAIIFGISIPVLFMCAGMAVDTARWIGARRTTAAAVDAAVLAGGRALQLNPDNPAEAIAKAEKTYLANIADRTPALTDTISFAITDNNMAVSASGSASIKTTILAAVGIHQLDIGNAATAEFAKATLVNGGGGSNVEISLMLDVTGSMCDDRAGPCTSGAKLSALKAAATELIDIVVTNSGGAYTTNVALVPFSTRVRVGPDGGGGTIMRALTDLEPNWNGFFNYCTQYTGTKGGEADGGWQCQASEVRQVNWKVIPCVSDRGYNQANFDATDHRPGSEYWLNGHDGTRMPKGRDSSNTAANSERGITANDPAAHWNYNSGGVCTDVSEANEIMPLSSDKQALKTRVDGLTAQGATAGALGTAWAWYLLSPEFANILPAASAPRSYSDVTSKQANGAPIVRKIAVLMTDGGFNTYRNWKDFNIQEVSGYARDLCTNMKEQGIEVFTVGYALDELPSSERTIAEDTLKNCGTDLRHFYNTLTAPQLKDAFRDIALQMTTVYLSK